MNYQLPKDWKWVKLAELADKISLNKIKRLKKSYSFCFKKKARFSGTGYDP